MDTWGLKAERPLLENAPQLKSLALDVSVFTSNKYTSYQAILHFFSCNTFCTSVGHGVRDSFGSNVLKGTPAYLHSLPFAPGCSNCSLEDHGKEPMEMDHVNVIRCCCSLRGKPRHVDESLSQFLERSAPSSQSTLWRAGLGGGRGLTFQKMPS